MMKQQWRSCGPSYAEAVTAGTKGTELRLSTIPRTCIHNAMGHQPPTSALIMINRVALRKMVGGYLPQFLKPPRRTGGADSARYCYSVWLRHLSMIHHAGLPTTFDAVAEIGPGDSIGTSLAALLSGAHRYFGFDVVSHSVGSRNLDIFDELVGLFRRRADIPDEGEFPRVKPDLPSYRFPTQILGNERLAQYVADHRVAFLRQQLSTLTVGYQPANFINYIVPWKGKNFLESASLDLVFSQSAMENVPDINHAYREMNRWLKAKGIMSHRVAFTSQGSSLAWNGHWTYSDMSWRLMMGFRPFVLNREPLSHHLRILEQCGFEIVCMAPTVRTDGIAHHQLARRFRNLSETDLQTSGAYILARKP